MSRNFLILAKDGNMSGRWSKKLCEKFFQLCPKYMIYSENKISPRTTDVFHE